jgi:hypothetical protein
MLRCCWPARCFSLIFHTTLQCYREKFVRGLPGERHTAASASKTMFIHQGARMRVLRRGATEDPSCMILQGDQPSTKDAAFDRNNDSECQPLVKIARSDPVTAFWERRLRGSGRQLPELSVRRSTWPFLNFLRLASSFPSFIPATETRTTPMEDVRTLLSLALKQPLPGPQAPHH